MITSIFIRYFFLFGVLLVAVNYFSLKRYSVERMSIRGQDRSVVEWSRQISYLGLGATCFLLFLIQEVLLVREFSSMNSSDKIETFKLLVFAVIAGVYLVNTWIMWFHKHGLTYAHVMTHGFANPSASRALLTVASTLASLILFQFLW